MGLQVAVLEKYEKIVNEKFQPLVDLANLLETNNRKEIEDEVKKELGIDIAEKKLAEMQKECNGGHVTG